MHLTVCLLLFPIFVYIFIFSFVGRDLLMFLLHKVKMLHGLYGHIMAYIDVITIMYTLYNAGSGDDRRPVILSDSVEKAIAMHKCT